MKNIFLFGIIAILLITSCAKERLTANGNIVTETRTPSAFTGIRTSGANPIYVAYGNEYKVEIRGSSNLIPVFESSVSNGKLYLNYEHVSIKRDDLEIFVRMPAVKNLELSGSGIIELTGNFPASDFLKATISGSGNISAKSNMIVEEIDVNISGSGDVNFEKISSKTAETTTSGSGDIYLTVQQYLKSRISGSGNVYYTGNAGVEKSISGSGKVTKF